jgi:hypothetical protein
MQHEKTIRWVRLTVLGGLIAGMALSPRLWLDSRIYPLTPVAPWLKPLAPPFDQIALGALLCFLVLAAVVPRRWTLAVATALLVLFALQDQSRWQPWFFQYVAMLSALSMAAARGSGAALNTGRLIVVSIYFWSGVSKLNPRFGGDELPWLLEPFLGSWVARHLPLIQQIAIVPAVIECVIGIGLLTNRFRRIAVTAAIAMHVLILGAIGPLGHRFNPVVWPWNLAMVALLALLFWPGEKAAARDILWGEGFSFQKVVLVFFGIMPVLSLFNLWDQYLSASLYSDNRTTGYIYLSDAVFERLPDELQDYVIEEGPNLNRISIQNWSYDELNVPSYPETRIYKNVAKRICGYAPNPAEVSLVVRTKLALANGGQEIRYRCSEL